MADNVTLPLTGTGDATSLVSTEEVTTLNGGAVTAQQVQRVAVASRTADGTAVDIIGDTTNGLDVDVTRSALPSGAATSANQSTANTSLATIAGAVAGVEMQVDVLTMPSTTVTASNLDIRDLAQATDSVSIGDGTNLVVVLTDGADNVVNTTNQLVTASMGYVFDGTTWDRALGNATDGALVNLGANNDVTVTGSLSSVTSITNAVTVAGGAAHASPASGNPNLVAGRASTAIPTDVGADGDAASMWTNRNGAQMVSNAPHIGLNSDPWNLVHEGVNYTTAQTSAVVITGGASEKIVVTQVQIQAYATTAGTAILYFGTGAYVRGTNRAIFDGEFAPSATLKPGVILQGPFIAGTNGDDLLFTSVGNISITISVWYYVVT